MTLRAVLFDLDGTLWRPASGADGIFAARRMEARTQRIAPLLGVESERLLPLVTSFWESWPNQYDGVSAGYREPDGPSSLGAFLTERGIPISGDMARQCWSEMRISAAEYPFELFADTLATLRRLRESRIPTALVTNNYSAGILKPDLDGFGIRPDVAITSADVGYRKPHRLMFGRALQSLGMAPGDVVMVGDSLENDVRGARACGIRAVLKLNGREATVEEREEADYLIDGLGQILDLPVFG